MRKILAAAAIIACSWASQASATLTTFGTYGQAAAGAEMVYNHDTQTLSTSGYQTNLNVLDVANLLTVFTFSATTSEAPVYVSPRSGTKEVDGFNGSFSFTLVNDTTISGKLYSSGSVLFSGNFTNAYLSGNGSSGSVLDASSYGTMSYSSPAGLLNFQPGASSDLAIALTQIAPSLQADTDGKLKSFSAASSGNFSADPPPTMSSGSVPEPATWIMMIGGFGLVGLGMRRNGAFVALN